jgi:hypothetical protein
MTITLPERMVTDPADESGLSHVRGVLHVLTTAQLERVPGGAGADWEANNKDSTVGSLKC